mmetsp:Transcript_43671/g.70870  ORF Transcript_43671/g.70870 Transcript_43671/m.70870 type:complete len:249 (+) Transcript_43671:994-1740(+)
MDLWQHSACKRPALGNRLRPADAVGRVRLVRIPQHALHHRHGHLLHNARHGGPGLIAQPRSQLPSQYLEVLPQHLVHSRFSADTIRTTARPEVLTPLLGKRVGLHTGSTAIAALQGSHVERPCLIQGMDPHVVVRKPSGLAVGDGILQLQHHVHPAVPIRRPLVGTLLPHHVRLANKRPRPQQCCTDKIICIRGGVVVAHKLLIQRCRGLDCTDCGREPLQRAQSSALARVLAALVQGQCLPPFSSFQ